MLPNDIPAVARYNSYVQYNGTTWDVTEQINTLGTITYDNAASQLNLTGTGLFKLTKTSVKAVWYRNNVAISTFLVNLTLDAVGIFINNTIAEDDVCLIEIEVFTT